VRATNKFKGQLRCSKHYRSCPVKAKEGGDARVGKKHSSETKRKIGAKSLGRKSPFKGVTAKDDSRIKAGLNHYAFGKGFTEEHKKNISKAHTGKILSDEHKKKLSTANSGPNNPLFGTVRSAEVRKKISDTANANGSHVGKRNGNYNPNFDEDDRYLLKRYQGAVMNLSRKNWKHLGYTPPNSIRQRVAGGVELDHKVPISICFKNNVSIERASSIHNLHLIPWKENVSKGNRVWAEDLLIFLKSL